MTIYVGRWNLLPKDWEGINGLYEKSEAEIKAEICRQVDICEADGLIAVYTPLEFEETFNHDDYSTLTGEHYFIKIF